MMIRRFFQISFALAVLCVLPAAPACAAHGSGGGGGGGGSRGSGGGGGMMRALPIREVGRKAISATPGISATPAI